MTSILDAARAGRREEVLELISTDDADPNESNDGLTPILIASFRGWGDVVEALLKKGADPNVSSELGETPLMRAIRSGKCEPSTIAALVHAGADKTINARTKPSCFFSGWSALHFASDASLNKYPVVISMLVVAGADPVLKCCNGRSPMEMCDPYPEYKRAMKNPKRILKAYTSGQEVHNMPSAEYEAAQNALAAEDTYEIEDDEDNANTAKAAMKRGSSLKMIFRTMFVSKSRGTMETTNDVGDLGDRLRES